MGKAIPSGYSMTHRNSLFSSFFTLIHMDLRNMAMLAMSAMLTCGFPDGHPALASKTLDENGKRPKHSAKQTTPTSPNNGYGGRLSAKTQAFMTKCKLTHPPKSPNKNFSISILGN